MQTERWVKKELKKVESEIQKDNKRFEEMRARRAKPKKCDRVHTTYELLDAIVYGVIRGRRSTLRELLGVKDEQ